MNTIQSTRLLITTIVVGTLLLTIPGVSADTTTLTEDFEDDLIGQNPTAPWYTYTEGGGSNGQVFVSLLSGDKVLFNDGDGVNTGAPSPVLTYVTDPCDTTPNVVTMSVNFRLESLPNVGTTYEIGFAKAGGFAGATKGVLLIDSAGAIKARSIADDTTTSTSASVGTLSVGAWHTLDLTLRCGDNLAILFSLVVDGTLVATADQASATKEWNGSQGTGNFVFTHGYGGIGFDAYIDDLNTTYTVPTPGLRFCAVAAEDNFGFDYVEDVTFDDDGDPLNGIGLDDFYDFVEDNGNSAYLGKAFDPGSTSFSMLGRVEAGDEGQTAIFRYAYTTGATTLTAGSAGDGGADMTAAGNGQTTGNFANNIQLELTEGGSTWTARIRYSIGGGPLTTILQSVLIPDPNVATLLNFTVDSINGPLGTGDGAAWVKDADGDILMSRDLPSGLQGATWKDAWFISTADAGLADTKVALDNNDVGDSSGSTCMYDNVGTSTVVGSSGSEPGGSTPPGGGGEDGGFSTLFDPDNIDAQLFIGFLLVAGMVFMGIRQGFPGAGIGALFFIGLFLGYALGWVPLWIILVLFVISLAAVWFLPKPSGDGV